MIDLGINKWLIGTAFGLMLAMGIQLGYNYFTIRQLEIDKENLQNVIVAIDAVNQADAKRAKENTKKVLRSYDTTNKSLESKLKAIEMAKQGSKNEDKCTRASSILDSAGF